VLNQRPGLYRPVHVKTLRGQKPRMLLTHCKKCFAPIEGKQDSKLTRHSANIGLQRAPARVFAR